MSTPLMANAVSRVRERLRKTYLLPAPSSMLVKAILIQSTLHLGGRAQNLALNRDGELKLFTYSTEPLTE